MFMGNGVNNLINGLRIRCIRRFNCINGNYDWRICLLYVSIKGNLWLGDK